jgi:AAA domain/Primase C terminal 1 (PriCT-1)/Bifunctional DNA primase/polymerase, N-terminal
VKPTPTAFGAIAAQLVANGYRVVPIDAVDRKRPEPKVGNWRDYVFAERDAKRYADDGVGILCGVIRAVDIDVRDETLARQIEALLTEKLGAAPRRIGAAPKSLYLYRVAEAGPKITGASWSLPGVEGVNRIEVLGEGQQFVAYGIHRDTQRPYVWNGAGDPLTVAADSLPLVTEAQLREFVQAADELLAEHGKRARDRVTVDFSAARDIHEGTRNSMLASLAGRLRRDGLSAEEIAAALQIRNRDHCKPPLPVDEVDTIARSIGRYETAAEDREPLMLIGFTAEEALKPIREETYLLPGLIPTDAYTLIAGALSAYKSTLLHNLIVWRATGHDLLGLGVDLARGEIGPCVLASYEDTDWRIFARLQRVLQNGYRSILTTQGEEVAVEFLARAEKNIKRVPLSGQFGRSLVCREKGVIAPNAEFLDELLAAVRAYTSEGILLGVDPLRLAVVGSQNDDDGADIVVHVLNSIPNELPGSGVVVCSHTTKQGAKEPGVAGYAEASYATSGSALYSQHARSNFLMTRLKPDEIRDLFDPGEVPIEDAGRQVIAKLTHGRLSHGPEIEEAYFRMQRDGVLIPVHARATRTAADVIDRALPLVAAAIERLTAAGLPISTTALESDAALTRGVGGRNGVRAAIRMLEEAGYLVFSGTTRNRRGELTAAGRARLDELRGANWRESTGTAG